jgi:tRNA (guanine26-N2/guanine27-N2)-dimethyltransferase
MQTLVEGTTHFHTESEEKITKDMPVFYNPVMKRNRDLTLAVLLAMNRKDLRIGLPMEASGIRAARILHELVAPGFLNPKLIALNDISEKAIGFAKKNIDATRGDFDEKRITFSATEANVFLRQSRGFDYIDIDPFGTPNPFLDSAVQRINRDGILAVTATDTSALAGTYPAATARKYWSVPSRTWVMHEVGLRILARKVQLVAAQYDKAVIPVLSVATDHYYRIFFRCLRSHSEVKNILREQKFLHVCTKCMQLTLSSENAGACRNCSSKITSAGPLWAGQLHEKEFIVTLRSALKHLDEKTAKQLDGLLAIIEDECKISTVGFIDLHELASKYNISAPRTEKVLQALGKHGARTHINGAGVKTDLDMKEFLDSL